MTEEEPTYEILFLTVSEDGKDVPSVEQLITQYGKVFDERNRPMGDAFEQQSLAMYAETAKHFDVDFTCVDDTTVVFFPLLLSKEVVLNAIREQNKEQ